MRRTPVFSSVVLAVIVAVAVGCKKKKKDDDDDDPATPPAGTGAPTTEQETVTVVGHTSGGASLALQGADTYDVYEIYEEGGELHKDDLGQAVASGGEVAISASVDADDQHVIVFVNAELGTGGYAILGEDNSANTVIDDEAGANVAAFFVEVADAAGDFPQLEAVFSEGAMLPGALDALGTSLEGVDLSSLSDADLGALAEPIGTEMLEAYTAMEALVGAGNIDAYLDGLLAECFPADDAAIDWASYDASAFFIEAEYTEAGEFATAHPDVAFDTATLVGLDDTAVSEAFYDPAVIGACGVCATVALEAYEHALILNEMSEMVAAGTEIDQAAIGQLATYLETLFANTGGLTNPDAIADLLAGTDTVMNGYIDAVVTVAPEDWVTNIGEVNEDLGLQDEFNQTAGAEGTATMPTCTDTQVVTVDAAGTLVCQEIAAMPDYTPPPTFDPAADCAAGGGTWDAAAMVCTYPPPTMP